MAITVLVALYIRISGQNSEARNLTPLTIQSTTVYIPTPVRSPTTAVATF